MVCWYAKLPHMFNGGVHLVDGEKHYLDENGKVCPNPETGSAADLRCRMFPSLFRSVEVAVEPAQVGQPAPEPAPTPVTAEDDRQPTPSIFGSTGMLPAMPTPRSRSKKS